MTNSLFGANLIPNVHQIILSTNDSKISRLDQTLHRKRSQIFTKKLSTMCNSCNLTDAEDWRGDEYDYSDDITGFSPVKALQEKPCTSDVTDVTGSRNNLDHLGDLVEVKDKHSKASQQSKVKTGVADIKFCPRHKLLAKNIEFEKEKFFATDGYNPQFTYRISKKSIKDLLEKETNVQSVEMISEAEGVLQAAVEEYGIGNACQGQGPTKGSIEDKEMTLLEAEAFLNDYFVKTRTDSYCCLKWANLHNSATFINRQSVSYARFKVKDEYFDKNNVAASKHYLYVSTKLPRNPIRLMSLAVHEIGTHLVRRVNEEIQPWNFIRKRFHLRKPGETREDIQTEEGFATINDTFVTPGQYLTQYACAYLASAWAKTMSFRELFDRLEKYVADKDRRWKFCVNAKRGCHDTSLPGGDGKVQSYFEGAVKILRNIRNIDIELLFCGKVALNQHDRVKRVVRRDGLILPPFAENIEKYRYDLMVMAHKNRLIDPVPEHLKPLAPRPLTIPPRDPRYFYSQSLKKELSSKCNSTRSKHADYASGSSINALKLLRKKNDFFHAGFSKKGNVTEGVLKKAISVREKIEREEAKRTSTQSSKGGESTGNEISCRSEDMRPQRSKRRLVNNTGFREKKAAKKDKKRVTQQNNLCSPDLPQMLPHREMSPKTIERSETNEVLGKYEVGEDLKSGFPSRLSETVANTLIEVEKLKKCGKMDLKNLRSLRL